MVNKIIYFLIILDCAFFANSKSQTPELEIQYGHFNKITALAESNNGKYLVTGDEEGVLILWDVATGCMIRSFNSNGGNIQEISFTNYDEYAIFENNDIIYLWDIISGNIIRDFRGQESIWSIKSTKDCKYILSSASGSFNNDKLIVLWDGTSGREIRTLLKKENSNKTMVTSIALSNDSKYAAALLSDGTLTIWNLPECTIAKTIKDNFEISFILFSKNDLSLVLFAKKVTKILNIESGELKEISETSGEKVLNNKRYVLNRDLKENNKYSIFDIDLLKNVHEYIIENKINFPSTLSNKLGNIYVCNDNTVELFSIDGVKKIKVYTGFVYGPKSGIMSIDLSPDKKYLLSSSYAFKIGDKSGRTLKIWDLSIGKELKFSESQYVDLTAVSFSANGNYAVTGSKLKEGIKIWNINNRTYIYKFGNYNSEISSVTFSPDDQNILVACEDKLDVWNYKREKEIISLHNFKCGGYREVVFSPEGNIVYEICFEGKIHQINVWDIDKDSLIKIIQPPLYPISLAISSDGNQLLCGSGYFDRFSDNVLSLWDIESGKILKKMIGHSAIVRSVKFLPDNKYALSGGMDNNLMLWDINSEKSIKKFEGHTMGINSICVSNDGKLAISGSRDNTIKLWDLETGKEITTLMSINENDYLIKTPDNYYLSSKEGYKGIVFRIENSIYPPEQFDLQYNRPDIVLERIGLADPELIKAYREAYYKRLRKMNFKEEWFKPDFYMPELKIENKDEFDVNESKNRNIKLMISAKDEKGNSLDRINVYVNGVPIYGTNGIDIRNENLYNIENKEIEIPLNDSVNKIEVSVLNHAGVESLKDNLELTYAGNKEEPKTYFIGIGVSEYQDKSWKLNFASKDIRDLAGLYKNKAEIDTLIDEQATRENILKLKEKLLKTNVNDEVIIALSGHGILNSKYDFYYATWDMDFQNPEKNGLLFDDLDKLLDSIPARKKVLLIDACNSGEVDKDTMQNEDLGKQNGEEKESNKKEKGDIPEGLKKMRANSKLGLKNSFELMQEIFVNLTRGNGAVVISAARGYQSALEDISYGSGNGAFTACILELFRSKKPGEHITVGELKDYVIKRVEEITNGNQKPTSRRENLAYDFVVW